MSLYDNENEPILDKPNKEGWWELISNGREQGLAVLVIKRDNGFIAMDESPFVFLFEDIEGKWRWATSVNNQYPRSAK